MRGRRFKEQSLHSLEFPSLRHLWPDLSLLTAVWIERSLASKIIPTRLSYKRYLPTSLTLRRPSPRSADYFCKHNHTHKDFGSPFLLLP
jgi:hypothetical protein